MSASTSKALTPAQMSTGQPIVPQRTPLAPLSLLESFACGGLAGCAAVTVCMYHLLIPWPQRISRS